MKIDYALIERILLALKEDNFIKNVICWGAGQYRINDVLDIYPRRKKWHSLSSGKRGKYFDLEDFVKGFFNPELRKLPEPQNGSSTTSRVSPRLLFSDCGSLASSPPTARLIIICASLGGSMPTLASRFGLAWSRAA